MVREYPDLPLYVNIQGGDLTLTSYILYIHQQLNYERLLLIEILNPTNLGAFYIFIIFK
jgi:hypothetical protein